MVFVYTGCTKQPNTEQTQTQTEHPNTVSTGTQTDLQKTVSTQTGAKKTKRMKMILRAHTQTDPEYDPWEALMFKDNFRASSRPPRASRHVKWQWDEELQLMVHTDCGRPHTVRAPPALGFCGPPSSSSSSFSSSSSSSSSSSVALLPAVSK